MNRQTADHDKFGFVCRQHCAPTGRVAFTFRLHAANIAPLRCALLRIQFFAENDLRFFLDFVNNTTAFVTEFVEQ